jgi:hypothetical protein
MRLTLAELIDRWTIELRKKYYGHGNEDLIRDVEYEIRGQLANLCKGDEAVASLMMAALYTAAKLGIVNADIASCEWQIRAGRELTLVDLGQRAVITRKLNDYRSSIKQNLSDMLTQNVETRHYGYGKDLDPALMKMEVQEPGCKFHTSPAGQEPLELDPKMVCSQVKVQEPAPIIQHLQEGIALREAMPQPR